MTEADKIKMQADLSDLLETWLDKQTEAERATGICSECGRMMAVAAIAVLEASSRAYSEGEENAA